MSCDTAWYAEHLADDFVCVSTDASALDKSQFLEMIAAGSDQVAFEVEFVNLRIYGDVALIRAIGSWLTSGGVRGSSHYTDVYVRDGQSWKVVSAQITRPPVTGHP